MSVKRLIEFFSMFSKLPIYAEDVRDHIVEMGVQDEILLREMDVPPDHLLGMFVRYRRRNGVYDATPSANSVVFYNTNIEPDAQNFVCIKELMHVFDDAIEANTRNREDFIALVDDLFSSPLNIPPFDLSVGGIADEMAVALALAILFPHEIRDDFIKAHSDGRMTYDDIGKECGLPSPIIPMLMSKKWEQIRAILLRIN